MFKAISISKRLILLAIIVIISIGIVVMLSAKLQNIQKDINSIDKNLNTIANKILLERKYEKDYLASKDLKYVGKFTQEMGILEKEISQLEQKFANYGIDASKEMMMLKTNLSLYKSKFQDLVKISKIIGLDPKSGYRAKVREAIHKVEFALESINNYKVVAQMLMLRRNEKDFLLRHDEKYVQQYKKNLYTLNRSIKELQPQVYKMKILRLVEEYERNFINLVVAYKKMGLDDNSGLLGDLKKAIQATDGSLSHVLANSENNLNAILKKHLTYYYLTILGMIVGGLTFMWFLISSITKPMSRLSKEIKENKNDLTQRYLYDAQDELGVMVEAINSFSSKLNDAVSQSKNTSLENVNVATELSSTSQEIATSLVESANIVEETNNNASEMDETMDKSLKETSFALTEMTDASDTLTDVSNDFHKLIDSIRQSAEVESELAQKLSELSNDAEQVKDILIVISDIADQTNLLALNAAIEAARAGEHGRGFAVVADEVRKLAERTQKSLSEIQASVNVIVQNIVEASSQISDNSEQFDALVKSSSAVDDKVGLSTQKMSDALSRITLATEFTKVTGEGVYAMMEKIKQINDISTQNAQSVQEITTASQSLSGKTESLNHQLDFFKTS